MKKNTIVSFGEIMLRLTPDGDKCAILNSSGFRASYGGSESNVLVALSAMGNPTRYLTKLPDNDLGRGAIMHLNRYGVDCSHVITAGDNMGLYFLEEGYAARQAKVIYARKHSEITTLTQGDLDYAAVLDGCCLFHISGISFALSASVEKLCFRLIEEAKKRNIPVSFDFNYRSKLWSVDQAKQVFTRIVPLADIVLCSQRDLTAFLDLSPDTYFAAYPGTSHLVVREREILSPDTHRIRADLYTPQGGCMATVCKDARVLERIGGGDAFDAGILHGLLHFGEDYARILDYAATCFVLKHTIRGDVFSLSQAELEAYQTPTLKDVTR